jgi:hypothetical protein
MTENRSTAVSGAHHLPDDELPPAGSEWVSPIQIARALVRLARCRQRLAHVPTLGQVRAMAWFDGREPCSYLLDRAVNFVPEPMEFGYESELGQHALVFTCQDGYGRLMELVTMRDGGAFDLLSGV